MNRQPIRKTELHAFILGHYKDEYRVVISISRRSLHNRSSEMYLSTMDEDALMDALDQPTEVYQVLGDMGMDSD